MPHQISNQDKDIAKAWMSELLPTFSAVMERVFLEAMRQHSAETAVQVTSTPTKTYPFPKLDVQLDPKEDVLRKMFDNQRAYPQPDLSNAFGGIYKAAPDHKIKIEQMTPHEEKLKTQKHFAASVNRQNVWAQVYSTTFSRLIAHSMASYAAGLAIKDANDAIEQLDNYTKSK